MVATKTKTNPWPILSQREAFAGRAIIVRALAVKAGALKGGGARRSGASASAASPSFQTSSVRKPSRGGRMARYSARSPEVMACPVADIEAVREAQNAEVGSDVFRRFGFR